MKTIQIKIISNDFRPFWDTTVGEEYIAHILEGSEVIPEPWATFSGQRNDGCKSIIFIDDVGDDVAQDFDEFEERAFTVL